MTTTPQSDELKKKQEEFLASFRQWRPLIIKKMTEEKKVSSRGNNPRFLDELIDRFQGHLWAVYDRFDPKRASFQTWLGVELDAFFTARARAKNMGRSIDGEDLGRIRRTPGAPRPRERKRSQKAVDFIAVGLPSRGVDVALQKGELSEEGIFKLIRGEHPPSPEDVLCLRDCIARLPKADQEFLREAEALEGCPGAKAEVMGIHRESFKFRLNRILGDLRSLMKTGQPSRPLAVRNSKPIKSSRYSKYSNEVWKEYFKTELIFYNHIYRQLYKDGKE